MSMPQLTIFTPTYNRAHLLPRLYESLKLQTCQDFEWLVIDDGSTDGTREMVASWPEVRYVYKENGGLYTGYNTAYANINTELSVCIDSDDYMPEDAVEKILSLWRQKGCEDVCGIVGLDFNVKTREPIGGYFPAGLMQAYAPDIPHRGDTKYVFRTDLMRTVAPMEGYPGEKDFNPHYMQMQILDKYPILVMNENLCWVDYQEGDASMSAGIYKQYVRSPRSFAKMRRMEMQLTRRPWTDRVRVAVHYVSACAIAKDKRWLKDSPRKCLTLLVAPIGWVLSLYVKKQAEQ